MRLKVNWIEATRPPIEVLRVEKTIEDSMLWFFDGVENAKKSHDIYCKLPKSPSLDWARAVNQGRWAVHSFISPTEFQRLKLQITFEEGLK